MRSEEKAELLKETIFTLYSKEGRSISYISRLLQINRKKISDKIKEWNFPVAEPRRHATPSTQKFINQHKNLILSRLKNDCLIEEIVEELGTDKSFLVNTVLRVDSDLKAAYESYQERNSKGIASSSQPCDELPEECWKPILGYEGYDVSNLGRIRRYNKTEDVYYLEEQVNKYGKLYVRLNSSGKNLSVQTARLVAYSFLEKPDCETPEVIHRNGNSQDNRAENLLWKAK